PGRLLQLERLVAEADPGVGPGGVAAQDQALDQAGEQGEADDAGQDPAQRGVGARADQDVEVLDGVAGDRDQGEAGQAGGDQPPGLGSGGAPTDEEGDHGQGGEGHQHDHAEGPDVAAPGEQVEHGRGGVADGLVVGEREGQD